jgi:hypothetical protein
MIPNPIMACIKPWVKMMNHWQWFRLYNAHFNGQRSIIKCRIELIPIRNGMVRQRLKQQLLVDIETNKQDT